jgi:CTP:molybdopterin cytidylyltransferase MocA
MTQTIGLLLAAGAGRRMGIPKALVTGDEGVPWVVSAARSLAAGGCSEVVVVIGAASDKVRTFLSTEPVSIVEVSDWEAGMGASLRAGLEEIAARDADTVLVHLVDVPDVGSAVVRRILEHADPAGLVRASYSQGPGHPVLLGRNYWLAIAEECSGNRGARDYLARHEVTNIDCSDLATGRDIDELSAFISKLE